MATVFTDLYNNHQKQILNREKIIASELVKEYRASFNRVKDELLAMESSYRLAEEKGDVISASWFLEYDRLEKLKNTIQKELEHYTLMLEEMIRQEQDYALAMSGSFTRDMMILGLGKQYDQSGLEVRTPSAEEYRAMLDSDKYASKLSLLMQDIRDSGSEQTHQSLLDRFLTGISPKNAIGALKDAFGAILNRILSVSRNEVMRAHRKGSEFVFAMNEELVEGWKWHAQMAENTCLACVLMHGTIFPVGESLDSHINCRCIEVPVMVDASMIGRKIEEGIKRDPTFEQLAKKYNLSPDQLDWLKRQGMVGSDYIKSLSDPEQMAMMGNARWLAWRSGLVDMNLMVKSTWSDEWGKGIGLVSMRELFGLERRERLSQLGSHYRSILTSGSGMSKDEKAEFRAFLERYAQDEPEATTLLRRLIRNN